MSKPMKIAFLPPSSDPTRCCLNLPSLLSSLSSLPSSPAIALSTTVDTETSALFWLPNIAQGDTSQELRQILLGVGKNIRFVQLPMTGVDHFIGLIRETKDRGIRWCCAKGCYAYPVAEHALALVLMLLRGLHLPSPMSRSLIGQKVLIVGDGSISRALQSLLEPFECDITSLNSSSISTLPTLLPSAQVVVLACALTTNTKNLFDMRMFEKMHPQAVLINVARGEVVDTKALLRALREGIIAAAGVDVITEGNEEERGEMERLKEEGKLVVTPHSAVPVGVIQELLGQRIKENVVRLGKVEDWDEAFKESWAGQVDAEKGY